MKLKVWFEWCNLRKKITNEKLILGVLSLFIEFFASFYKSILFLLARRNIYLDSQHPGGWEKIQSMEQRPKYEREELADVPLHPPRFTLELRVIFFFFLL